MDDTEQAADLAAMHDRALYVWEGRGNWDMESAAHKATSYTAFEMAWDAICEEFLRRHRVVAANAWDEGYVAGGSDYSMDTPDEIPNPYRITEENN